MAGYWQKRQPLRIQEHKKPSQYPTGTTLGTIGHSLAYVKNRQISYAWWISCSMKSCMTLSLFLLLCSSTVGASKSFSNASKMVMERLKLAGLHEGRPNIATRRWILSALGEKIFKDREGPAWASKEASANKWDNNCQHFLHFSIWSSFEQQIKAIRFRSDCFH